MDDPARALGVTEFRPRFPWLTADLQTLRNHLLKPRHDLSAWRAEALRLDLGDGDALAATVSWPQRQGGATVLLLHGLTGCADSTYMRATAAHLLAAGHAVVRLDLRGAGASRALCRASYHAGRSEDLRAALAGLPPAVTAPGLAAVGYSLGANLLAKYLAEQGEGPVAAAVLVSTPLDLAAAARRLMAPRNRLYHRWLLERMQAGFAAPPADLTATERAAIAAARSVLEFDDRFVAPRNGFADAADYHARCSAGRHLPAVRVRTLVVHALDDPWIPAAAYRGFDWSANPALVPLLSPRGGHVGFHQAGDRIAWHDRAVVAFLARA